MKIRTLLIAVFLLPVVGIHAERGSRKEKAMTTYVPKPGDKWCVMEIRTSKVDYNYEAVPEKLYDTRKKEYVTIFEYKYEKWRGEILEAKFKKEAAQETLYGIREFDSQRTSAQNEDKPDSVKITYNITATLNNGATVERTLSYRDVHNSRYKGDAKKAFVGEVIKKDKQFTVPLNVDPGPKPVSPKIKNFKNGLTQDDAMKFALDQRIKMQKKKR